MEKKWLQALKQYGKYVITVVIFAVIMVFFGDQSLINYVKRSREIRHLEEQRDSYREGIKRAEKELQVLQNTDSLEQYAREHYYMHAENEDVYILE
ncbi:MAG: septum formation initiator family protein [Paludibacteraceae bacterium]